MEHEAYFYGFSDAVKKTIYGEIDADNVIKHWNSYPKAKLWTDIGHSTTKNNNMETIEWSEQH